MNGRWMVGTTGRTVRDLADRHCRFQPSLQILDYWLARQCRQDALGIPEFDPIDVRGLLSFLYLLEQEGGRLKYRVSGEDVNTLFSSQHTGKYFDEVVPEDVHSLVAPFFHRVFTGCLCLFKGHVVLPNKEYLEFERVLLPVTRQGRTLLLGCLSLSTTAETRDHPPQPPSPGFHFTVCELDSGEVETTHLDLAPQRAPDVSAS